MTDERADRDLERRLQEASRAHAEVSDDLRRRVEALGEAFRRLVPAPSWIQRAVRVAEFELPLVGITTRAAGSTVMTEAINVALPEGFDPQINVDADGVEVRIELEASTDSPELWATAGLEGELIAAPFVRSADDPRVRVATLPYGGTGPLHIEIVTAPPRS